MRALLTILILTPLLFAATLLNRNIYERENRVDLMLSFDAPFDGSIKKSEAGDGSINIRLSNVHILKPFAKELQSSIVESIAVTGAAENSALIKIVPSKKGIKVEASKTVDGFGLRIRIVPAAASKISSPSSEPRKESRPLTVAKTEETLPGWRYWSVLGIMALLLLVLWLVKRKRSDLGGWLMPGIGGAKIAPEGAVIRYQKVLDQQNRLILLEFNDKQYLMVVGNSNLLLDTFSEKRVEDQESFTSLFEANKKQLDHFLKENHPDAYEAFKANATRENIP